MGARSLSVSNNVVDNSPCLAHWLSLISLAKNTYGGRKSLNVLKVEVKVILAGFGHISIRIMLLINRELSERKKT